MSKERKSQYYNSLQRLDNTSSDCLKKLDNKTKYIKINTIIIFGITVVISIVFFNTIASLALITSTIINTISISIAKNQTDNINIQKNAIEKFKEFINLEMIIDKEQSNHRSILENYQLASKHSNNLYNCILTGDKTTILETTQKYNNKCTQDLSIIEQLNYKKKKKIIENKQKNKELNNNIYENNHLYNTQNNTNNKQYIKSRRHL